MVWIFGLLVACQSDNSSGFSTTGTDNIDPDSVVTGTGSGDSETDSETGTSSGGVNPVISAMDGFFVDVGGEILLEMHVFVEDEQDDLLNGYLEIDYTWGDQGESLQQEIDGDAVVVETGELTFFIPEVDAQEEHEVFLTVYDEAGNPSEQASTKVSPFE